MEGNSLAPVAQVKDGCNKRNRAGEIETRRERYKKTKTRQLIICAGISQYEHRGYRSEKAEDDRSFIADVPGNKA